MKTYQILLISFFSLLLLMSFKADTDAAPKELIGYWIFDSYIEAEDIFVYKKVEQFEQGNSGIAFLDKGVYIDRNGGPCGTPPIIYYNYSGNWAYRKNKIKTSYKWTGLSALKRNYELISVDDKILKIKEL